MHVHEFFPLSDENGVRKERCKSCSEVKTTLSPDYQALTPAPVKCPKCETTVPNAVWR